MKLRNKKTGEIFDTRSIMYPDGIGEFFGGFSSLAELNAEWEDYEEPKDNNYWYIDDFGGIHFSSEVIDEIEGHPNNWMIRKQFGNYFSSREEAEKAVEKLKAWKRLKDNGISFKGKVIGRKWYLEPKSDPQQRTFDEAHDLFKDVKIIFGGEE